jgi:hypothetical protein
VSTAQEPKTAKVFGKLQKSFGQPPPSLLSTTAPGSAAAALGARTTDRVFVVGGAYHLVVAFTGVAPSPAAVAADHEEDGLLLSAGPLPSLLPPTFAKHEEAMERRRWCRALPAVPPPRAARATTTRRAGFAAPETTKGIACDDEEEEDDVVTRHNPATPTIVLRKNTILVFFTPPTHTTPCSLPYVNDGTEERCAASSRISRLVCCAERQAVVLTLWRSLNGMWGSSAWVFCTVPEKSQARHNLKSKKSLRAATVERASVRYASSFSLSRVLHHYGMKIWLLNL